MIRVDEKLKILFSDNGSITDISDLLSNFRRDTVEIEFTAAEDYLYVGFEKPINTFYVELNTPAPDNAMLSMEYHDGTSWVALEGFFDDTKGFSRSGFIRWDRNQEDESATTVNSVEKYYYRISLGDDVASLIFRGIGIVFSDDEDLKEVVAEIDKYLPTNESSHILSHVAARKEIIQQLRVDGRFKQDLLTGRYKDLSSFDLLDITQVNEASKYLTLSKIYYACSDLEDDVYMAKAEHYRSLFNIAMKTFYLSIDVDDDGISDIEEELASNNPSLYRR